MGWAAVDVDAVEERMGVGGGVVCEVLGMRL